MCILSKSLARVSVREKNCRRIRKTHDTTGISFLRLVQVATLDSRASARQKKKFTYAVLRVSECRPRGSAREKNFEICSTAPVSESLARVCAREKFFDINSAATDMGLSSRARFRTGSACAQRQTIPTQDPAHQSTKYQILIKVNYDPSPPSPTHPKRWPKSFKITMVMFFSIPNQLRALNMFQLLA